MKIRSRFEPPSNEPSSDVDVLVLHTLFTGNEGIGRIIHIEPAGDFANTRATGQGQEFLENVGWGNVRLVHWIGELYNVNKAPQVGKFVLFDELYAAPALHAGKLVKQFQNELEVEIARLEREAQSHEFDV